MTISEMKIIMFLSQDKGIARYGKMLLLESFKEIRKQNRKYNLSLKACYYSGLNYIWNKMNVKRDDEVYSFCLDSEMLDFKGKVVLAKLEEKSRIINLSRRA